MLMYVPDFPSLSTGPGGEKCFQQVKEGAIHLGTDACSISHRSLWDEAASRLSPPPRHSPIKVCCASPGRPGRGLLVPGWPTEESEQTRHGCQVWGCMATQVYGPGVKSCPGPRGGRGSLLADGHMASESLVSDGHGWLAEDCSHEGGQQDTC